MKYILLIFILLLTGCFSKPTVLDFGFEKLKNFTEFEMLPDGVPVYFEDYVFILTNPTSIYKHGILGDSIEAETLTYFNSKSILKINFSPQVFEGLFPIVKDNLILTTLSGNLRGAQIVGFDFNGEKIFSSSALSSGWRHILDFESGVVIDVVKPHVLGELELLEIRGDELVQVSSLIGYSTHQIGSRNLNIYEVYIEKYIILPTFDFSSVAVVSFTDGVLEEVLRVEFDEDIYSIENILGEIYVNDKILKMELDN